MRGGILLRAVLALMVGVSLVTIGTPAAMAATTGRFRTQPAGRTPALDDLGPPVPGAAGATQTAGFNGGSLNCRPGSCPRFASRSKW